MCGGAGRWAGCEDSTSHPSDIGYGPIASTDGAVSSAERPQSAKGKIRNEVPEGFHPPPPPITKGRWKLIQGVIVCMCLLSIDALPLVNSVHPVMMASVYS